MIKDGAFCVVTISPFLIILHEAVEVHWNWKIVLQICKTYRRATVQTGEVDSAQEVYAALSLIDVILLFAKVKVKSRTIQ
jgi:hypothetical protein